MITRSQLCAVIDLRSGSAASRALSWEACWNGLPHESAAALITGPLTGTGVPGGSGMTWLFEGFRCSAEGRAASALRYAGWNGLLLSGACPEGKQADLSIYNGEVTISYCSSETPADPKAVCKEVLRARPSAESVTLLPSPSGIIEDGYFSVSTPGAAQALLKMGVRSITITGTEPIELANPAEFQELCVSLWEKVRESGARGDAEHPIRHLSVLPDGLLPRSDESFFARLGLCWGPCARQLGGAGMAKKLLLACTGEAWEEG